MSAHPALALTDCLGSRALAALRWCAASWCASISRWLASWCISCEFMAVLPFIVELRAGKGCYAWAGWLEDGLVVDLVIRMSPLIVRHLSCRLATGVVPGSSPASSSSSLRTLPVVLARSR